MTTNGMLLGQVAAELKDAGLRRVNISLDSAGRRCYTQMTGSDLLSPVMSGMTQGLEVGLTPVRLNCVVMRDVNAAQIPALAEMTLRLPVSVRFIEYCPTSPYGPPGTCYVPSSEVRQIIESRFGPLYGTVLPDANGPAVYFKVEGSAGAIGFISGRSSAFCHRCTRLRLTSDGQIRPCLFSGQSYDLKGLLRGGAGDSGHPGSPIEDRTGEEPLHQADRLGGGFLYAEYRRLSVHGHITRYGRCQRQGGHGQDGQGRRVRPPGRGGLSGAQARGMPKGDVLATAKVAAIQAVKSTPALIPMCHPILVEGIEVDFLLDEAAPAWM